MENNNFDVKKIILELEEKTNKITSLEDQLCKIEQKVLVQNKIIEDETLTNSKLIEFVRKLLIEKSEQDRKLTRQKHMENNLRLGQYKTESHGLSFAEKWTKGYAFNDLYKVQERISFDKMENEKQRKLLNKKKPSIENVPSKSNIMTTSNSISCIKQTNLTLNQISIEEWSANDEILKLRNLALKREDSDLQSEFEKLERERHLHIRESKRISQEDNSRFNHETILNERYQLICLLGKGGFSEVHKVFDFKEGRYSACKIHQLNKEWNENKKVNYVKHAIREYNIHKTLQHQHIVKLYDIFEIDDNSFCTVMEFCPGSDLDLYLKQYKRLEEREARSIITQIVSALRYLNLITPPVIHYDLKPANILLLGSGSLSGEIKVTDFGLSKTMQNFSEDDGGIELTSQGYGTYWYLPPECFIYGKKAPKISSKVDVWSIGVIFYECLFGKKPFGNNLSQAKILEQKTILKAIEVDFPLKPVVSSEAKQFITRCLQYKQENRLDVAQLYEDEYLKTTWPKLKSQSQIKTGVSLL